MGRRGVGFRVEGGRVVRQSAFYIRFVVGGGVCRLVFCEGFLRCFSAKKGEL